MKRASRSCGGWLGPFTGMGVGHGNVGHPTPQDSSFLAIHISHHMFLAVIYADHWCNTRIISLRYLLCHVKLEIYLQGFEALDHFFFSFFIHLKGLVGMNLTV